MEWHEEVNTRRPSRATRVIPAERLGDERRRLRPLRVTPDELALRIPIVVPPTGIVVHETHPYSMPPDSIGLPGTLYLHRERVRIVAGRFAAEHPRSFVADQGSMLPEHRAQRVDAVPSQRAKRYVQREHLLGLGAVAVSYLTEIVHRRPRVWIRDVDKLHELLLRHGDDVMRDTLAQALTAGLFGSEYITHFLDGAAEVRQ